MPIYKNFNIKLLNKSKSENISQIRDIENIQYYKNYIFNGDFRTEEYRYTEHIWSHGDKLYKLADKYFGDRNLFWLIGLFNNKPTDSHFKYGDIVFIPLDYMSFYQSVVK